MAVGRKKAVVIDVNTMELIKVIDINTHHPRAVDENDMEAQFLNSHVFPETDCRFVLETWDKQMIKMRSLETGA